ncbi:putative nucleotidyltransferase substrate binding domain-containing protein [Nocardioides taihuensis]|uniref:Nucleotidyltransferase substrate binding domain-containing protein n=1 Tax=Nocardioides taihuensis TaxID=1835606 RepID=A0ABW0BJE2_9ACTN
MKEYVDFLGSQPPYDALSGDELERLLEGLEVEFFAAGTTIVQADGEPLDHLWVVRTGLVEVVDRGRVVDHLVPGDTFGHISVLTGMAPALTVRAAEDSLCLRLPDPRSVLTDASRLRFSHFGTMISRERLTSTGNLDHTPGSARGLMRPLITAEHDEPVSVVAGRVTEGNHSAALVRSPTAWGVVTDRDFRGRVATGEVPLSAPVGELASFPAITISEDFSQAAAFSRMIAQGVHHLVIVDSRGTPQGIIRAVDFASAEIRNPLQVRGLIDGAGDLDALQAAARLLAPSLIELGASGMPASQIGSLHASIIDAVLRRMLELLDDEQPDPAPAWVVLGSLARREPLPHSDVDTALVLPGTGDHQREDCLRWAEQVLSALETCGLSRCDNGANATNPLFARSRDEWDAAVARWLADPMGEQTLLLSSIVIDSRPVAGVALGRTVTDAIRRHRPGAEFLGRFVRECTAVKPPSGFVREFVVDHGGHHRGQLDLKRGGLLPVAALGRWVAMVTGDARGGTLDRLRRGREAGLLTHDEADTLDAAFDQVYDLLLRRDLASLAVGGTASTYLDPRELDSLTRRHLRETFRAVASVQESVLAGWTRRVGA